MKRTVALPDVLEDLATTSPELVVLIQAETGRIETAGSLWRAARSHAAWLRGLGVGEGDFVATISANSVDTVRLWIAISSLGAVEVPISTELRGGALRHALTESGATTVVVDGSGAERLATETLPPSVSTVLKCPQVVDVLPPSAAGPESGTAKPEPIPASDLALVLFTSGTTGPAKGVLVTWGQVLSTSIGTFPEGTIGPDSRIYNAFPPNHISARVLVYIALWGGAVAVSRERFSASHFWPEVDRYRCTAVAFAMTMARILLQAPPRTDDRSHTLKDVMVAPLIPEWPVFAERFDTRVCTLFTMTEVSTPLVSGWNPEVWSSCGRPRSGWPHYRLRLIDELEQEVATGEIGQLICRTDDPAGLNSGYLNRPEETEKAWRGGWFHTGDLFRTDEQGRYHFAGRLKDAIRHRGENVSAHELEREAAGIDGVSAAAAVGVPSAWSEEDIYLFVVPDGSAELAPEAVRSALASRVPKYMVPAFVEIVAELPLTATGKVHKAGLRVAAGNAVLERVESR